MALKDRFQALFSTQNLTQKQFADLLEIAQSTFNNYLNGVSEPNFKNIMTLVTAFPTLNANWLLRGEGNMYLEGSESESENGYIKNVNQNIDSIKEDNTPQYKPLKKEKPALPDDVEVLKKAVELLQIEMWKLKGEVEEMKKKEKK